MPAGKLTVFLGKIKAAHDVMKFRILKTYLPSLAFNNG